MCVGRMEEHVFGLEYNSNERTLQIYKKNSQTNDIWRVDDEAEAARMDNLAARIEEHEMAMIYFDEDDYSSI